MIDINIKDGTGNATKTEVTTDNALKVATIGYDDFIPAARFFQNDTFGIDINRNFSNVDTTNANELIHNGTDDIAWTGSAISGDWDFASTDNPDTGLKNIEIIGGIVGNTAQIARGLSVTMVNHTGFTGRIYLTDLGHPLAELDFYAWDTASGTVVGSTVNLYDYINVLDLLVYQTFSIPLTDMGLVGATFDAVRFQIVERPAAIFDLDNIYLTDPTGGSGVGTTVYHLTPNLGRSLHLDGFIINMADTYAGTVANGTMPNIPYNGFLGEPELESPIVYQVRDYDRVTFAAAFSKLIDFMQFASPEIRFAGSDGINTWVTLYVGLKAPIVLHDNLKQSITLTLSSDLSGLDFFRFSADCRELEE